MVNTLERAVAQEVLMRSGPALTRDHLQASCSQLHPISITCAFSASSQYSPQYLLPDSHWQSQAVCAHFLVSPLSAMTVCPLCYTTCGHPRTALDSGQAYL